jgi:hypothetical protein
MFDIEARAFVEQSDPGSLGDGVFALVMPAAAVVMRR